MEKWARIKYMPVLPLGENGTRVTSSASHIALSRQAAEEGIVLLKNNDAMLPLKKGTNVALFGMGQIAYFKVGGGSGDVHSEYTVNIYDGIKNTNGYLNAYDELSQYYVEYVAAWRASGQKLRLIKEAPFPEELLEGARSFADTAIITISRHSSESIDRRNDGTDDYFYLSDTEKNMVERVCDNFDKVVILLNTGAMIDTSWFAANDKIDAALAVWQGGMEGGTAVANVLMGEVNPSGKLVDTCAASFDDYPSSEGFHESEDYVKYTEDIFVGYRYFETIPGKKQRVIYPFGYGMSYTEFVLSGAVAKLDGDDIVVNASVKNVGGYKGKEVVQVYYSAPDGKMTKPALELCAFAKTKLLECGEEQTLTMRFAVSSMASYDDIGDVCKSAWVLEGGEYKIFVGNSIRSLCELDYKYVTDTRVVEQLTEYLTPRNLGKRLLATGEYVAVADCEPVRKTFPTNYHNEYKPSEEIITLRDVSKGKATLDEFISQLTDEELARLLKGKKNAGVANTCGIGGLPKYGVPTPMTADGPAGVRIEMKTGVRTTAFPIATLLACTWNLELVEKVGRAGALECKENNLPIWLTPGLNIHRSPLCGRNFEYYSEDPFVAGKMAAATVRGIQSVGIVATPKHFACNNKETNRKESDSIASERAIREIYIKGFEICVKEASPKLIMTAYNIINGVRASENAELIMGILRGEWGYEGVVTTDWRNHASFATEVKSGNDVRMPLDATDDIIEKLHEGYITRDEIAVCVKRLLEMILWME
ncbi:MAG: beta-glucosidase [Ruminococcaceae bacterium]|nr:beta-glucosidase [Oscillospiraceae bacterium]